VIGIGRDADSVVVYLEGETVLRARHLDSDALRARVLCRVADRLLRDAVGRDLDSGREHREITRDLESNGRRALPTHHRAEFGVLLKCRQQASMVEGWGPKSFHQAANVCECRLLQGVQLL
jgi:hypothetical protein